MIIPNPKWKKIPADAKDCVYFDNYNEATNFCKVVQNAERCRMRLRPFGVFFRADYLGPCDVPSPSMRVAQYYPHLNIDRQGRVWAAGECDKSHNALDAWQRQLIQECAGDLDPELIQRLLPTSQGVTVEFEPLGDYERDEKWEQERLEDYDPGYDEWKRETMLTDAIYQARSEFGENYLDYVEIVGDDKGVSIWYRGKLG